MGTIRIEFVPIALYNLGLFGLDHIQLVLEDETDFVNLQDYWKVLEGTFDGGLRGATLGVLGEEGTIQLSTANDASREALVAKIGTPESRGSRIIKIGPDALSTWRDFADYAKEIQEQQLPYIGVAWPFGPTPIINYILHNDAAVDDWPRHQLCPRHCVASAPSHDNLMIYNDKVTKFS